MRALCMAAWPGKAPIGGATAAQGERALPLRLAEGRKMEWPEGRSLRIKVEPADKVGLLAPFYGRACLLEGEPRSLEAGPAKALAELGGT